MKKPLLLLVLTLLAAAQLPALTDGDYLYTFTRITNFPEMEQQYKEMGMVYRTVTVEIITGMVVTVKRGRFDDPSIQFGLAVDAKGKITSPDSDTISGTRDGRGNLFWSGQRDHYGQKARMVVTGTLISVTNASRADARFDGVYLLEEEINGQKMAARIKGGYLTFESLDKTNPEAEQSGWPTLVGKDGSIYSVYEFITRVDVAGIAGDSSNFFVIEGIAAPGALSLIFHNSTATTADMPGTSARRVYAGQQIREADLGQVSPRASDNAVPRDRIPFWYFSPDNGPDWLAASGCKRMEDREAALKAAETMAAAGLALQIQARVKTSITLWSRVEETGTTVDVIEKMETTTDQISFLPLNYTVLKAEYDEKTKTAWVMVGITKKQAETAVQESFLAQFGAATATEALETAF